ESPCARVHAVESASASAHPNTAFAILSQAQNLRMRRFDRFETAAVISIQTTIRCPDPDSARVVLEQHRRFDARAVRTEFAHALRSAFRVAIKQLRSRTGPNATMTRGCEARH